MQSRRGTLALGFRASEKRQLRPGRSSRVLGPGPGSSCLGLGCGLSVRNILVTRSSLRGTECTVCSLSPSAQMLIFRAFAQYVLSCVRKCMHLYQSSCLPFCIATFSSLPFSLLPVSTHPPIQQCRQAVSESQVLHLWVDPGSPHSRWPPSWDTGATSEVVLFEVPVYMLKWKEFQNAKTKEYFQRITVPGTALPKLPGGAITCQSLYTQRDPARSQVFS